jgi:hypothetical protein
VTKTIAADAVNGFHRAEVFQEGGVDEGIETSAHRAEHEVAPAQLLDERACSVIRLEIWCPHRPRWRASDRGRLDVIQAFLQREREIPGGHAAAFIDCC